MGNIGLKKPDRLEPFPSDAERCRLLVDAVTDYAIYMIDPQGIVRSWNQGARRFEGYEAFEIIGQHFSRFYTEEDRAAGLPESALAASLREGKFGRLYTSLTQPDFWHRVPSSVGDRVHATRIRQPFAARYGNS